MATVRVQTIFSDDRLTVTAVESMEFRAAGTDRYRVVTGNLKPVAVIVTGPEGAYALDMAAQPIDIDRLELPADFEQVLVPEFER